MQETLSMTPPEALNQVNTLLGNIGSPSIMEISQQLRIVSPLSNLQSNDVA